MVFLLVCPAEKLCEVKKALRSTAVNKANGCEPPGKFPKFQQNYSNP